MNSQEYFEQPRINLTGGVNEKMLEDLDRQIKATPLSLGDPAVLTITSAGGSVGYARAIYEELTLLQDQVDLTIVARGICLSAAVTLFMAVPRERRLATPNTKFLIHQGSRGSTTTAGGSLSARELEMDISRTDLKDDQEEGKWVYGVIADGCNKSYSEVSEKARNGLWLVGKKAVKFGLVSGLVTPNKKP